MKLPNWLLSSTGKGLALRWKSFFSGIIPVVVLVAPLFGIEFPELEKLNEGVSELVVSVWAAGSAVSFIVGWVRQIKYKNKGLGKYIEQ